MPKVFICHSSADKDWVRKLYGELKELGIQPWLDEREIAVGECIPTKIEQGIREADYLVLVLSTNALKSGWFDREWKARISDEIDKNKIYLLPALIERCEIPLLLKSRKYADFVSDYNSGLLELVRAINSPIKSIEQTQVVSVNKLTKVDSEIIDLIKRVTSTVLPLSQSLSDVLAYAIKTGDKELETICKVEIAGVKPSNRDRFVLCNPRYRQVEVVLTVHEINTQSIAWGGSLLNAYNYMLNNPKDFWPGKIVLPESLMDIESKSNIDSTKTLFKLRGKFSMFVPDSSSPDLEINSYMRGDTYQKLLESIRNEITNRLLDKLPEVSAN